MCENLTSPSQASWKEERPRWSAASIHTDKVKEGNLIKDGLAKMIDALLMISFKHRILHSPPDFCQRISVHLREKDRTDVASARSPGNHSNACLSLMMIRCAVLLALRIPIYDHPFA
jgi:hypothetical protein